MKKVTLLLILFISFKSFAQSEHGSGNSIILNCSDPVVRLSPVKIPCKPDGKLPQDFDIPNLRIDLEDLEKIFQGAESSGGHTIGPMGMPRNRGPRLPFPLILNCSAELLADGGKTISFISQQDFQLDQSKPFAMLFEDNWTHFLVEGNDFSARPRFAVNQGPKVKLSNYKILLELNKEAKKLSLMACESNFSNENGNKTSSCSLEDFSLYRKKVITQLRSIVDDRLNNVVIKKTLKVSCKRIL